MKDPFLKVRSFSNSTIDTLYLQGERGGFFWHGVCYELNNPQYSGFWYHVDLLEISNHSQNHMESIWEYLWPTCLSLLLLVRQGYDP
jgi:hypothetical protein